MPRFLVAIHHPDNFDPSIEDDSMRRDIDDLNDEMEAAGARLFACGLHAPDTAKSLRASTFGIEVTDGPYLPGNEHVGGFWILECADMDEAVAWGKKAVVACRTPVEVRQFH